MAKAFRYLRGSKPPTLSRHRQSTREVSAAHPGAPEAANTICLRAPTRIRFKRTSQIATLKYYVVFKNGLRDGNVL